MARSFRFAAPLVAWLVLALPSPARGEDAPPPPGPAPDVLEVEDLPEVVVTATRVLTPENIVPRSMSVVDSTRILRRSVSSALDALDDEIGVWIEKRTAHASDPVIRGLSGGNILALVDSHTLSTFWGEGGFAGDDMYGKIDPEMIERIEVVRGPSSVLYGSNALGGVINFITKASPFDYTDCGLRTGARSRVVLVSNPRFMRLHQEVYGAGPETRWLVGGTYWDSGDVEDGGGQLQVPTGGHGGYANARLSWRPAPRVEWDFTLQHTDLPKIYRYYRPTQDNSNLRTAAAATLDLDLSGRSALADEVEISLYYQNKTDRRRWFGPGGAVTKTGVARWKTLQAGIQAHRELARHAFTYGASFESTWGESPDDEQFTETPVGGTPKKAAPDSVWSSIGFYAQDRWDVAPRLTLTGSLRVDLLRFSTDVDSQYVPGGGLNPLLDEFTDNDTAVVGGVQASVHVTRETDVFGGWTRGFRQFAPHFGVSQHGYGIVVPSRLLTPVTADQFELGLKHRGHGLRADAAVYYTKFRNFQNIVRSTFQGQDWYDFNQDGVRDANEDVFVTAGNGRAYVYGVEVSGELSLARVAPRTFSEDWSIQGGFAWNTGRDQTNGIPIRHTHPAWGRVALRYENVRSSSEPWFEFAAKFVRRFDKIPPSRLAGDVGYLEDPQDPTSGMRRTWGLPGYSTFDVRAGFKPVKNMTLVCGVTNIFDRLYRAAHARMDAPGRSFYASLEVDL